LKTDYDGEYWTQEMADYWEISQEARDEANSIMSYRSILRKDSNEFYTYWEFLNKEQK